MTSSLLSRTALPRSRSEIPPLHNGDRLSQPEFHRRYEAMPSDFRAELIGGVVYVSSPQQMRHGNVHYRLAGALGAYEAETPGVEGADNATVILGSDSEPQPDLHLRLLPAYGGRSRINDKDYLVGPPELVIEVAHSSEAIDLDAKRADYERAGVLEYLVLCVREKLLKPFDLKAGRELKIDSDGIYRSKVFPGLWIDPSAVLTGDITRLLAVVQQGLAAPEHATFVDRLKAVAAKRPRNGKPRPTRHKKSR